MKTVKQAIYVLIQSILWVAFIVGMNDAGVMGAARPDDDFLNKIAPVINQIYHIADILTLPVQMLGQLTGWVHADTTPTGFPYANAPVVSAWASAIGVSVPLPKDMFAGVLDWWLPITSILVMFLSGLLDFLYESIYYTHLRNWVWNVAIEYLFNHKRVKIYEQALDQRNADLAQMSTRYTSLAQETHSLKDSVITDELTKIYNKRFFLSRMQSEFDNCKSEKVCMSIVMIDIDFFKRLNDNYGHLSGDEVLKAVAAVLKRFCPDQCYPCRYGGEEFAIIMPRKNGSESIEAARLIQENIQMLRFNHIDTKLRVTVSQGICTVDFANPESTSVKQFDTVLELADKQLYKSKMEGRNRVSFYILSNANNL